MTAWVAITDAQIDADSPGRQEVFDALRARVDHLMEVAWGSGQPRDVPHQHAGFYGGAINAVCSANFLRNSLVDSDATEGWDETGASLTGDSGYRIQDANDRVAQAVLESASNAMFGSDGNDWCLSFFAKSDGAQLAGTCYVGLSNASTFIAGCRATLAFSNLSTSWRRFYILVSDKLGGATDAHVQWVVNAGFTDSFVICGFDLRIATELQQFGISPNDYSDHETWERLADQVPIFDTTIAIDNAVNLSSTLV